MAREAPPARDTTTEEALLRISYALAVEFD